MIRYLKIPRLLVAIFLVLAPISVSATGYTSIFNNIYYYFNTENNTASVVKSHDNKELSGHINIPETIIRYYKTDALGEIVVEHTVTSIESSAFEGCTGITSISIPNSVTSIGGSAFSGCSGLTSISIPNSVTSIGNYAFDGCSGLTSVTISNSVTSIAYRAFSGCSGLTSIFIPNSVTEIGYGAFDGCSGLTSVTIGNSVTSIGKSAFSGCSGLTGDLTIPNSVTSIGPAAFYGCSGLTGDLTIPNSVTEIGYGAFDGCSGLTSVTIGNSLSIIESGTFWNCSGLTSVTISNSVTYIAEDPFLGCSSLKNMIICDGEKNLRWLGITSAPIETLYLGRTVDDDHVGFAIGKTTLKTLTIGDKVTSITYNAFKGCSGLTGDLTIPNSVTSIGGSAFEGCSGLKSVTIPNSVTSIGSSAFYGCSGLTGDLTIPNSVTTIGMYVFDGCSSLTSVTIPNSVTEIGWNAFHGCSGLANLILEDGEDAISGLSFPKSPLETVYLGRTTSDAFASGKTSLKTLTIGDKVTSITKNAFNGCSGLTSVTIGNSVTSIVNGAFRDCSGLTSVTIPNSVTSIGGYAFYGCSGLTGDLTIPNSVTSIDYNAFSGCSGLTSVTIPNSVISIGDYAFYGCSGLTGDLTIPNSVTSIGYNAFESCSGLTSVSMSNSITSISNSTFDKCSGLTSVTIPNSVTTIGMYVFNGCSGLTSVTIPNSVTSIGGYAFKGCSGLANLILEDGEDAISGLSFPESPLETVYLGRTTSNAFASGKTTLKTLTIGDKVTSITNNAFNGCSGLTGDLIIPNSVTSIGEYGFNNCSGLNGNLTLGNSVATIGRNAFNGCSGLTGDLTIPNSVTSIGYEAFDGCSGLTSVTIGNSVTEIDWEVFSGCSGLTSVTIPNSVTSIGGSAFEGCSGLANLILEDGEDAISGLSFPESPLETVYLGRTTSNAFARGKTTLKTLTIGDKVTSITNNAFYGCSGLTSVTIGNSVTSIGNSAFYGCSGLTGDLIIPNSVTSIGNSAFYGCSGLTGDLTIPNSVTEIGDCAFYGCSGLTSVTIPNSVTSIGNYAFNGCSGLTSVIIPNSVTEIGGYAFYGCSGLTSVTIPNSVTSIGRSAFKGCSGLANLILEDGEDAISGLSFPESPLETVYLGRTTSNAFASGKTTLKTLTIGDKVTSITNNAFKGCSGLTGDLIIPNSVTSIGDYAFEGCSGLTGDLIIPNSVTEIGDCAFYGCSGLTSVTIPNSVTSVGGSAFEGCSGLTGDLTIPNSVTEIGYGAFYGCSGLTSVTIPNSITSIGNYVFGNCSGLAKVYCAAATPPDAYYGAFSYQYTTIDGAKAQTQLYVPASSVDLYKSTSPWSNFLIGQYGELKLYKSSYYTFDNYYTEDKTYKSMNGVTADGTSQIFIPIEEDLSPSDFSIILTINGEPASIETAGFANQAIQKMPNGEKGIIYTAPKTFDESCMSNSYIVELTFDMINENGLTNIGRMPIEIEVHRPGLLMVHGLNSSSECWSAMQNDLLQSGLYRSAQINNINYSSSNLSSFDYNTHEAKVLEKGVKSMHNNLINNGIVSSKYDMIGHSMGGVLIRKYAQEVDGAADMVNSIITVNTPHHGSQLANIGMYVERIGSNYLSFLKPFIDYVTLQSAIYDLQIDGAAIKKLNQKNCSGIPVHVISSTIEDIDELYSRDIRQENVNYSSEDISNSLGNIIEVIEAPTEGNMKGALENFYKLIYSDKSDGIVSLSSQQGGLSGLCATNNIGQIDFSLPAPMWSWAHHCLNTKWDVTMNDIKALLCASKQGNGFTTGGFKYPLSAYSNTSDLGSLTFAEPQAGSFIKLSSLNTSDLQEVKVTVSDDVVSHCVYYILDNKLVSALDCDTARFIMPHWYEGGVTYYSLAKTNYGALITDSIYVDVKATDVDGNYLIYTPEELTEFAKIVNSDSNHTSYNAKLMADIDLENAYWTPICETGLYYKSYGEDLGYSGTFDGNGHVIRNLKVKSSTIAEASYGLFGTVSGTIKNLGIDGFKFEDGGKDFRAGAIVGQLITNGGKVSNCYVKNATIAPRDHVCGGIAGCAYEATIENCYVTNSTIIGYNKRYGHIVGDTRGDNSTSDRKGYVNNCYTDNSIVYSAQSGNISNCKQVDSEQFASGEVAYLLQGEQAEQIWGQNIDNGEEVQLLPTLYGAKVYYGYKDIEGTNTLVYTNDYTISENAPVFTQWKYYYNDTNWENLTVYTYVWDASNGNKEYLGSWPGTPMQKNEEGMWEISFETTDSLVDPMVIFSNGYSGSSNQTADLILINNGIYNFSGYTNITGVDIPHNPIMKIEVVNSMIIITAERDDIVSITSADGRTRFYEVKMGKNYISDLPKGFYIVNKTKVVL